MAVRHRLGDHRQKKRLGAEEGPVGAPLGCWYPWRECGMVQILKTRGTPPVAAP